MNTAHVLLISSLCAHVHVHGFCSIWHMINFSPGEWSLKLPDCWSLYSLVFKVFWAGFWCPIVSWISFAYALLGNKRLYIACLSFVLGCEVHWVLRHWFHCHMKLKIIEMRKKKIYAKAIHEQPIFDIPCYSLRSKKTPKFKN